MTAVLGNILFPAPSYAYWASFFWPVAGLLALVTEVGVFVAFNRTVPFGRLGILVLSANVFSWISGLILGSYFLWRFIPSGFTATGSGSGHGPTVKDATFTTSALLGFALACVLSIVLELAFIYGVDRLLRLKLQRLMACVGLANVASYALLLCWMVLYRAF